MPEASRTASIRFREEYYPPYDAAHGTPHAMVRRLLEFELPEGQSQWEQTDYGHPDRFNPWDPRGIDTRLQAKTAQLKSAAEAFEALLS